MVVTIFHWYIIGCLINAIVLFVEYNISGWYEYKYNQALMAIDDTKGEYTDEENKERIRLVYEQFHVLYMLQSITTILMSFVGFVTIVSDIYLYHHRNEK